MTHNYELVVTPTLAKGDVTLGTFFTKAEAAAAAKRLATDWPPGSFKFAIREVDGD